MALSTWLRYHGIGTPGTGNTDTKIAEVPAGQTIERIITGWSWSARGPEALSNTIMAAQLFYGVQTVRSGYTAGIPVPNGTPPMHNLGYPPERWLYWEVRQPVAIAPVTNGNWYQDILWRDSGPTNDGNSHGQARNNYTDGQTLDVHVVWDHTGLPPELGASQLSWWAAVLYS